MKPIDESLPETVITWLRLWRTLVLVPLRAADPPWTLERMSAELTRRTQGDPSEGGARTDVSGTAKATLQRFFSGERVPARDVVQHLLDIAQETLTPPPTREVLTDLWTAHRAALHTTFPLLADLYDALDQRDAARARAEDLHHHKIRLTEDLALSRRQEQRLEVLLRHSAAELEHARQTAIIRDDEARRARSEVEELTCRVHELEEQYEQSQQDELRLEREIVLLREQDSTGALTRRITDLQAAVATVRADNKELESMVRTVTRALRDAQAALTAAQEEAAYLREGQHRQQLESAHGSDTRAELELRHQFAVQAVAYLSEQLRDVSRQLADARAELIRRDGALARLVEAHAQEIASLRADRVLAEADTVVSMALQHLDPAPAALPPARNVPAPETTSPPSSPGPTAAPDPPAHCDAPAPGSAPGADDGLPPHDIAGSRGTAVSPHPTPGTATTRAQAPQDNSERRPQAQAQPQPALTEMPVRAAGGWWRRPVALSALWAVLVPALGAGAWALTTLMPPPPAWTVPVDTTLAAGPTTTGHTVYAGDTNGTVYALNAVTGHTRWTHPAYLIPRTALAADDDSVFVSSQDGSVSALDAATGQLRWSTPLDAVTGPVTANGLVFAADHNGRIQALNASTGHPRWNAWINKEVGAGPVVSHGTVIAVRRNGLVYALNAATGHAIWSANLPSPVRNELITTSDKVFLSSKDGRVHALDLATGRIRWSSHTGIAHLTADKTSVYACTASGKAVVYALDADTGHQWWRRTTAQHATDTAIAVSGDVLYAAADGKTDVLYAPTGESGWGPDLPPPPKSNQHISMVPVGGTLYATTAHTVRAINIGNDPFPAAVHGYGAAGQ
ncbi:outer membrane protein assembly factor BamB family protein [Streptomyces griseorubiginosus]|uniref:outer membrane protein assembly factor BamB family protein n=1 Tax=Streptomyces griseorubiginosus TaxID=67304 RepID=UPI0036E546C1